MTVRTRALCFLVLGILPLAACGGGDSPGDDTTRVASDTVSASLYQRLGGQPAIVAVVDSFVARVAADARINQKFARSDIARVKAMLVEQICTSTGGPCAYSGRSMKEAHLNMGVTEGEFTALVEDLVLTLDAFRVGEREKNELLATLGTMKGDIVEVPGPATGTPLPRNFVPAGGSR